MRLEDGIRCIKGIGDKTEKLFFRLGILNVEQLLRHYPVRYDVYEPISSICELREGQTASIEVSLLARPRIKLVPRLKIVECQVRDKTGTIDVKWFNMPFLAKKLYPGVNYLLRGKVVNKYGTLIMEHPQILTKQEFVKRVNVLQPVYRLTDGLTNHMVAKAMEGTIKEVEWETDYLPTAIRKKYQFMDYKKAIRSIHFPKNRDEMTIARNRLAFDEFFTFFLALNQLKQQKIEKSTSAVFLKNETCRSLEFDLPYELTNAQKRVWKEIQEDLSSGRRMNRLLQGDVGSGKTVIAALALLMTVENGYQGAIMVPTEILAIQHQETLEQLIGGYGIQIELLTGSMTMAQKRKAYERIASGEVHVIVGTHALIQEKCEYHKLGLVITDEQHRFGVKQREALFRKGKDCHVLVMSATPIPRSLAIILYGDMDISILDELPANRLPIKTCLIKASQRQNAYRFIQKELKKGRQAYVICPMVEENDALELENVVEYTETLRETLSGEVAVEYLHGQMKANEKNRIMEEFSNGGIQVLVSTTVVEVGVDVPNATVMMIENAERFGLAALHQLRGRVGRGEWQSYCILVSGTSSKEATRRLNVLTQSNDGFFISSEDLRLRGPGDMFGIRQSGLLEFQLGDIYQDAKILKIASEEAKRLTEEEANRILKIKNAENTSVSI